MPYFNPHLPCGRWLQLFNSVNLSKLFQSTPSLRKVTFPTHIPQYHQLISIHTFLAEGDDIKIWKSTRTTYFNPHLPCGRWRRSLCNNGVLHSISIHTFLAEGDYKCWWDTVVWRDFNPHLPCGRWRKPLYEFFNNDIISIHTFLAEGDALSSH